MTNTMQQKLITHQSKFSSRYRSNVIHNTTLVSRYFGRKPYDSTKDRGTPQEVHP